MAKRKADAEAPAAKADAKAPAPKAKAKPAAKSNVWEQLFEDREEQNFHEWLEDDEGDQGEPNTAEAENTHEDVEHGRRS